MSNKPNKLTPFSLKTWQENPNLKVVTRDGRDVRDILISREISTYTVFAEILGFWYTFMEDGKFHYETTEHVNDLFFADPEPEEEMYVNLYQDAYIADKLHTGFQIFKSKQEAFKYKNIEGHIGTFQLTKVTE